MLGWGLVMLSHHTAPVTLGNHSNHLTIWVTTVGILWAPLVCSSPSCYR